MKQQKINKRTRMYPERIENISCFRGCEHTCSYCAFRSTLSRAKKSDKTPCEDCRTYTPHAHLEVLKRTPKPTPAGTFSTIALNGDICFASDEVFKEIIKYCNKWNDRTFLIQSKNPAYFLRHDFPENVMLGTTLESNRQYPDISSAPNPENRMKAMLRIPNKRTITIEPIEEFDLPEFYWMITQIVPYIVWVGYDSKPWKNRLQEPTIEQTTLLIDNLRAVGIDVRTKDLRTPII